MKIRGVELNAINEQECIGHILSELAQGRGGVVVTPNLDHLRRCEQDIGFKAVVAEAEVVVADGMPVVWASRLQGTPLPQRVAGSDLITSLSLAAAEKGRSIFLLGGSPGSAEGAAEVLRTRAPGLRIAGSSCPKVGFESDAKAMNDLRDQLIAVEPDIVFVALGSPKQELLIDRLRPVLPRTWWLGVGVSFSFLAGDVRRAPNWMRKSGLEWMHRLTQEPKRLFKRYIVSGLPYAASLLTSSILRRLPTGMELTRPAMNETADEPVVMVTPPYAATQPPRPIVEEPVMPVAPSAPKAIGKIREIVLLAGSVRSTPLRAAVARSVLDLPIDERTTLLTQWAHHASELAAVANMEMLPIRVLSDPYSPEPRSGVNEKVGIAVQRDRSDYRGSGGVLGDLAAGYEDDDLILVATAAQLMIEPLSSIALALDQAGGDVAMVSHADGTPGCVMLLRAKTLRAIPKDGYIDLKEQALPAIARKFDVRVVVRKDPVALPVRTLNDYVHALRHHHRSLAGRVTSNDPLVEDWRPSFSIVEDGATIDPTARIHDSIILAGATVEAGAVVVRSVVGPGAVVKKDERAVEQFVTAGKKKTGSK